MIDEFYIYFLIIPLIFFLIYSKSKLEFIILLFISTYILTYIIAYYLGIRVDVSSTNDNSNSNSIFVSAVYVFYLGYLFQKFFRSKKFIIYKNNENKGLTFLLNCLLVILLLVELSLTSFDIFKDARIYSNLTKDTYIFEFINIIYVFYYFNLNNKKSRIFIFFVLSHVMLSIFDGHRLMALSSGFLLFIIYILPHISIRKTVLYLFSALILLEGISLMRSNISTEDAQSVALREDSFSTHQGSVIYSTLTIIDFSERYDVLEKIIMSSQYTLSLFFSEKWLPNNLIFSKALSKHTYRPGGGLIIGFAYAFFGYLGVFVCGYFVSYVSSWGRYINKNLLIPPYAYLMIIMIPRYFSYTPLHIFKTILFTTIIYYVFYRFKNKTTTHLI